MQRRSTALVFLTLWMTTPLWASPEGVDLIMPSRGDTVEASPTKTMQVRPIRWRDCLRQPRHWYASEQAVAIGDNVLLYQNRVGGWDKNIDMAQPLSESEQQQLRRDQVTGRGTIDNGATTRQMMFLARVYQATELERFEQGFLKGVDYLLRAQYPNGGWPQFYPLRRGYYQHITFNDNAMISVMNLLKDIAEGKDEYDFVDESRCHQCEDAIERGLDVILKMQVRVDDELTVWCAQHDEVTLAPANARSYELVSLSGQESVGIVRYLMALDDPSPEVKQAIHAACAWFEAAKITGKRLSHRPNPNANRGFDRFLVDDPKAGPLWARFVEIGTNQPMFIDRDGIVCESYSDLSEERRNGYSYLGNYAGHLLEREYPAWKAKWGE